MSGAQAPARRGLELVAEQTDRAASLICRGTLDARGLPRLRMAIDAALARPSLLVYLDLEDVTSTDAAGARLIAATIRRCAAERVHLELWPGAAVERGRSRSVSRCRAGHTRFGLVPSPRALAARRRGRFRPVTPFGRYHPPHHRRACAHELDESRQLRA